MLRLVCVFLLFAAAALPALAQTNNAGSGAERVIVAYRLSEGETVTVDGRFDEAFWSRVDVVTNFREMSPNENDDPEQPTRVRVAYDAQNLYVAWEVVETRDDFITAQIMELDGPVYQDDWVRLSIDPFRSGRDSYNFGTNANGARMDFLIENNLTITGAWDATWQARVTRHAGGWNAEMKIPFNNLSFPPSGSDWGIDFGRVSQQEREVLRWSQFDRALGFRDMSGIGRMEGITGIDLGLGLEVETFATTRLTHVWEEEGGETDLIFSGSGNAYYKITNGLTGTITVNTDFSDTPADPRIVSTSRFDTFFDETRDFFLQDSAIFEFGGRAFGDESNGLPFFSRSIGLVDSQIIDLMAGGKLSGRVIGSDVGALVTVMDDGAEFESQILGIGRISRPVLDASKVGAIFINGDPNGDTDNWVGGVDFQYSGDLGQGNLAADMYFLNSYTRDATDEEPENDLNHGQSYGGVLRWSNSTWLARVIAKRHEEGYNPQMGFLSRPETQFFSANMGNFWQPNGDIIRRVENWKWNEVVTDLDFNVQSRVHGTSLDTRFASSDQLNMFMEYQYEVVDEDFELPGEVLVPAGEYDFARFGFNIEGAESRMFAPAFEVQCCEIFGGDYIHVGAGFEFRPHPKFTLGWSNDATFIDLPTGSVDIYVTSATATISFTPEMMLITDVQYDNISGNMNIFSRYTWEFSPGAELFIGLGHNADVPARDFANEFSSNVSSLTFRLGKTFVY